MSLGEPAARLALVSAVLVGLMVAGQSRINAALAVRLTGVSGATAAGLQAALISFATGLLILLLGLLLMPRLRQGMRLISTAARSGALRPWHLLGGAGGAWLVATQGLAVPTLGVALFIVAVVAGQTGASLVVDALGVGPRGRVPISGARVAAAGMAITAVLVIALPQSGAGAGWRALMLALLVLTAGAAIAVQQAVNARVAIAAGYAPAAAVVNFAVGTTALSGGYLGGMLLAGWRPAGPPGELWLYTGGALGVAFIAIAAWAVPVVGVLRFALASIAGQLLGGAVLDLLLPTPGVVVGWPLAAGLILTFLAVAVGNRGR